MKKSGKWLVRVVNKYEPSTTGTPLCEGTLRKPIVQFYCTDVKWDKKEYPYGQFVASYYLSTLLEGMSHNRLLRLDCSVPSWTVEGTDYVAIMTYLSNWAKRNLKA